MRYVLIVCSLAALGLSACQRKPVYTAEQRDVMVRLFERYCMARPWFYKGDDIRRCARYPYFIYKLKNGQEFIGEAYELNRRTGAIKVAWTNSHESNGFDEEFYPGSSRVLPGKITRVIDKYALMITDFSAEQAIEKRFDQQSEMTMDR